VTQHARHTRGLLDAIEAGDAASQRRLASRLGIALGLTNLLLRRVVAKGWVKVVHVQANRVSYLLTPAGIAAKARLTREYLAGTIQFYADARERVCERFAELSTEFHGDGAPKRIVFYGAGEIAEIGYVSLQETEFTLIGVVDASRRKSFFGIPVQSPDALTACTLGDLAYDKLVVMSFDTKGVQAYLDQLGVGSERVFWV
jgi:DNA-binding MarR family transcriptional regulator